ncbi:carboxylating nicotinate-nucleotide diphosphorylase [Gordonia terrae]|uniref:carboxylating nicotinate-nucleotide diphosphorylase n=1 Tax=Gordonia terrae TaxID=2055 RepID=UPI003F6C206A
MSAGVSDDFVGQAAGGELGAAVTDEVRALIRTALDEDLRYGPDVTTASTVPADAVVDAAIISRAHGVIAGVPVVEAVFDEVIGVGEYSIGTRVDDGGRVEPGTVVLSVHAPTRALLTAERTALNLISHMSGIATATAAWVAAVEGTGARIRDSRKTLPGLRHLQKYAVRAGGGVNHRMGLGDAALIKDNHVVAAGSVAAALRAVRDAAPGLPVEVEVDSLSQLDEVLELQPQLVLLDNFEPWATQMAVQRRNTRSPETKLESSGGLSLDVAADYARTGVDYLAVGALTHSVTVLDLGLDIPAP